MYTIKQAAQRSGVSVPLLRAWERRYGIVSPSRTASGYRLYDDEAVERLRAMRRLVDEGWTASEAARALLAGEAPLEPGPADARAAAPGTATPAANVDGSAASPRFPGLIQGFVAAAARMDAPALEAVLDEALASGSFEQVAELLLLPALRALGDAWQSGTVDVAGEHAASQAVGRRLAAAFAAAGRPDGRGGIIVGLPPGSRHELGALAFATAARRSGVPVLFLGADVPVASWVEAAQAAAARGAVVAVPTRDDAPAAAAVIEALGALGPGFLRAVGGRGADAMALPATTLRLPAGLLEASGAVRMRLEGSAVGLAGAQR